MSTARRLAIDQALLLLASALEELTNETKVVETGQGYLGHVMSAKKTLLKVQATLTAVVSPATATSSNPVTGEVQSYHWNASQTAPSIADLMSKERRLLVDVAKVFLQCGGGHHAGRREAFQHGVRTVIEAIEATPPPNLPTNFQP